MFIEACSAMLAWIIDTFVYIFGACWTLKAERTGTFEFIAAGKNGTCATIIAWRRCTKICLLAILACIMRNG
jgi:uncharacterized PurR-regulated membrane protein YhhQ (DUF165 family)